MQFDSASGGGAQLETYVEQLRAKLPVAPQGLIDGYVRWAPWVAIVFGVLGVLGFLLLSAFVGILLPFMALGGASGIHAGGLALIDSLLGLVGSGLGVVGGVMMLQRKQTGWWIFAAGLVIWLVSDLFGVALLSLVITLAWSYIHVEARPQYH